LRHSNNALSGALPSLSGATALQLLDFSNQRQKGGGFSGTIPLVRTRQIEMLSLGVIGPDPAVRSGLDCCENASNLSISAETAVASDILVIALSVAMR